MTSWFRLAPRVSLLGVLLGSLSLGCPRASPPQGPQSLLLAKPDGARSRVDVIEIGDESREALVDTQAWTLVFPRKAILTFGVGARWDGQGDIPGWGRFVVALDGKEIARETVNPRVAHDWKDVTLRLDAPPREGRLSISMRYTDKDGVDLPRPAEFTLAVSEPTLHDQAAYGMNRGVILISVDTLRRDHVGAYGYSKPTTPTLDSLAKAGVLADDAVSVSSWTLPSHLSMLTSVLPGTHGGVDSAQGFNRSVPSVAAMLKVRGYATHAVTSHLYVSKTYGVDDGFDSMNFRQDRLAANVANHAMDLIDRFGDRPFFIFLHFYDPHWHYAPPPEILKLFESSYAGKLTGLYPTDAYQALLCDEVLDAVEDANVKLGTTFGLTGDALKEARTALVNGALPLYLGWLQTQLQAHGGDYFADHRLTIADLKVFTFVRGLNSGRLDHVPTDLVEKVAHC